MKDPAFKTQLFRFVDVLPSLASSAEIVRHLQEYLGDKAVELNPAMKVGLAASGFAPALIAGPVKANVVSMAAQFVAGETADEARDLVPAARGRLGEGGADEAGGTGEKNPHDARARAPRRGGQAKRAGAAGAVADLPDFQQFGVEQPAHAPKGTRGGGVAVEAEDGGLAEFEDAGVGCAGDEQCGEEAEVRLVTDDGQVGGRGFEAFGGQAGLGFGFEAGDFGQRGVGREGLGEEAGGLPGAGEWAVPERGGREGGLGAEEFGEAFDLRAAFGAERAAGVLFLAEGVGVPDQVELHRGAEAGFRRRAGRGQL